MPIVKIHCKWFNGIVAIVVKDDSRPRSIGWLKSMLNKSLLVERTQNIERYFINRQPIEDISKFWVMRFFISKLVIWRHFRDRLCHIIDLTPFWWQYLGRIWFTPYVLNLAVLLFLQLLDSFYKILQSLTFLGQTHRVIRQLVTHVIVMKRNKFKCIS